MINNSIKIKLANDSDCEKWDEFVLSQSNSSPYHLFAWRCAIEDVYKHKCHYLYAERNNEIIAVLPMAQMFFPLFMNKIVCMPFCDVGNCIAIDGDAQDVILHEAINLVGSLNAKSLQVRGDLILTNMVKNSFIEKDTKKVRMVLNLPDNSDALFEGFKSKLRSQIRKSEKNGVSFRWCSIDHFEKAYEVFSHNMHALGSPVHSKAWIKSVIWNFCDRAKLGIAEYDGKTVGMGIVLFSKQYVSIPWASTAREYNRYGPNMLIYWNLLKYSADNGYKYFDFGRSTKGEGTYKFKAQWGAKPSRLVWYDYSRDGHVTDQYTDNSSSRNIAANIWKKVPFSVATTLGPMIRKYISL